MKHQSIPGVNTSSSAFQQGYEDVVFANGLNNRRDHWVIEREDEYHRGAEAARRDLRKKKAAAQSVAARPSAPRPRPGLRRPRFGTWRPRNVVRGTARTVRHLTIIAIVALVFHISAPNWSEAAGRALISLTSLVYEPRSITETTARMACGEHIPVRDATGSITSFTRRNPDCREPADGYGSVPVRFAAVDDADATLFARFIQLLEGSHSIGSDTFFGMNLVGLFRGVSTEVKRRFVNAPRRGGSSGLQSAVEVLYGLQVGITGSQKRDMAWKTVSLAATSLASDLDRDRFVASLLPVAIGAPNAWFGPQIAGGMVPTVLFGKERFRDLQVFELCLAAAAVKRPIMIIGPLTPPKGVAKAEERLRRVKARAHSQCLDKLLSAGTLDQAEYDQQLLRLRGYQVVKAAGRTVDPGAMRGQLPGVHTLVQDLRKLHPDLFGSPGISLSVTAAGQAALDDGANRLMDAYGLRRGRTAPALDILSIAIRHDQTGDRIVAAYQSRRNLWFGAITQSDDGHVRGKPARAIASTIKATLVPLFLIRNLDVRTCREILPGFQDPDGFRGDDCSDPAKFVTLDQTIGRSLNLPIARNIRAVGIPDTTRWIESLGGTVYPQSSMELMAIGITTGSKAIFSPERLARAFTAIGRGTRGDPAFGGDAILIRGQASDRIDLTSISIARGEWERVGDILGAPFTNNQGTLRKLAKPIVGMGCDVGALIGKSGTSETDDPSKRGVRDRLILFTTTCGTATYTVLTIVGSNSIRRPLRGVLNADVRRLARATLRAALISSRAEATSNAMIKEN